mgnify:CR=1 FL=1
MRTLSLESNNGEEAGRNSLIEGMSRDEALRILEKTDDTLVKKRKNLPRDHGNENSIVNTAQVKGEMAQYAYPMSDDEKLRVVERYADMWEHYFYSPIYVGGSLDECEIPSHPWTRLKEVREMEGGKLELSLDQRYALRFVKVFYAEKWRSLG